MDAINSSRPADEAHAHKKDRFPVSAAGPHPPPAADISAEIPEGRRIWERQKRALQLVAGRPTSDAGANAAYAEVGANTSGLVAAADKTVAALEQRNRALQQRGDKLIGGFAGR